MATPLDAAGLGPDASGQARYSRGAMAFHWLIAALIILNIIGAVATEDMEGPVRGLAMGMHKAAGMTVLVLSVLRLGWRLGHRPPPLPAAIGRMTALAAHAVHGLFYLLMFALPVSGWLMISAASPRRPFSWFGLFDLPYLPVEGDKALQVVAHDAHEILFYLILALLALHVGGAVRHHFAHGRTFLFRMMPGHRSSGV